MSIKSIADDIIDGGRITRDDDLDIFLSCDLDMLCECADEIRNHFCGKRVISARLSMVEAEDVLKIANIAPNQLTIILVATFMAFYKKSK